MCQITNNDQQTGHGMGSMTDEAFLDDNVLQPMDEDVGSEPGMDEDVGSEPGMEESPAEGNGS